MLKKIIVIICIAPSLICGIIFYWPQSFSDVIAEDQELYVWHQERVFNEYGTITNDFVTTDIRVEAETEQFAEIMKSLSNYTFRRSLRTIFGEARISGGGNETLQLYSRGIGIHNIGSDEILIDGRVYHIGYWGDEKAQAMISDIKAIIVK